MTKSDFGDAAQQIVSVQLLWWKMRKTGEDKFKIEISQLWVLFVSSVCAELKSCLLGGGGEKNYKM